LKIRNIKINGFGKLENREIDLGNHVNLVYGKNEAGKTTFLKFIPSMFFGISKNKKGKDIADFDKYTPWGSDEFSGKISYELDNGDVYDVFRDFKKKSPVIYNASKDDISKQFNIDKTTGSEFFYEQTGIDEGLWTSTSLVEQQEVVLDNKTQNILTQKISNLLSTGNDNVSYQKSLDSLDKKLKEEVGTERTVGRPINNVNQRIKELTEKKEMLEEYSYKKEELEARRIELKEKQDKQLVKVDLIREIKEIKEDEELEQEKIKAKSDLKLGYEEKIKELQKGLEFTEEIEEKGKINVFSMLILLTLIIINIVVNVISIDPVVDYIVISITASYLLIRLILFMRSRTISKRVDSRNLSKIDRTKREIEINKEYKLKIDEETKQLMSSLGNKTKTTYGLLKHRYAVLEHDIESLVNMNFEQIKRKLEEEKNKCDSISLQLSGLGIEEKNIISYLDKKASYEEGLAASLEEKEELLRLENIFLLARESLENAYEKMKNEITPKFTKDLSSLVEEVSRFKIQKC